MHQFLYRMTGDVKYLDRQARILFGDCDGWTGGRNAYVTARTPSDPPTQSCIRADLDRVGTGWKNIVLLGVVGRGSGNYTLQWKTTDKCVAYQVRYSEKNIVDWLGFVQAANYYQKPPDSNVPWFAATRVSSPPTPATVGTQVNFDVTGLDPAKTYYFAVKYLNGERVIPTTVGSKTQTAKVNVHGPAVKRQTGRLTVVGSRSKTQLAYLAVGTPPTPGTPGYRGHRVHEKEPGSKAGRDDALNRGFSILDAGMGPRAAESPEIAPSAVRSYLWQADSHAEVAALRQFVDDCKGRLEAFWLPTLVYDLTWANAPGTGSTLTIHSIGYSAGLFPGSGARRHLSFRQRFGTVRMYRMVTAAVDNGDGTETLTLDSPLDTAVTDPGDWIISFLRLCRMEDDQITIDWQGQAYAEAVLRFHELPAEAPIS